MNAPPASPLESTATNTMPSNAARWRKIGVAVGVLLLIGAVVMLIRQRQTVIDAVHHVQHTAPGTLLWLGGIIVLTVIANIVLTAAMFSLLIARFGKVGVIEMQALIACSTLLNFVPMRAGMLGRVAYHRAYNAIPVTHSARVVIHAVALSVLSAVYLAAAIALSVKLDWWLMLLAAIPLPGLALASIVFLRRRLELAAALAKYADLLVSAIRYWAAFALIGSPIEAHGALAFACISALATMVPFLSNGLGLREWALGITTPLLTRYQLSMGVTADLLNRAAEIIVALPAGLIGFAILAQMRTRRGERRSE